METEPLGRLHVAFEANGMADGAALFATDVVCTTVHPAASVTVTAYVPATMFVNDTVVAPMDQTKVYGAVP